MENLKEINSIQENILKDSPDSPDEEPSENTQNVHWSEAKETSFANQPQMSTDSSFIMWENDSNICWLDASMALLVHNQTMRQVIKLNPDCQVSKIFKSYDDAISKLNDFISDESTKDRLLAARDILKKVQESSLKYLQPLIKCKKGEPDSAFCSLLNLIKEDKLIQGFFDVTYAWVRLCDNCENHRVLTATKPIITIANVNEFVPESHISPGKCQSCKKKDQKMKLVYKKLPACLIFHFENGAGDGNVLPLKFLVASREYQLTGVMMLEKAQESNVNHFVTYIRDPSVNRWLECNDLNMDVVSFSEAQPELDLKDVYIYVYEAFDDLGTIETEEDPSLSISNHNIPCIDISDEEDAKIISPNKIINNTEPEIESSNSGETVARNINAFLTTSIKEDSNSNSNTKTKNEGDTENFNSSIHTSESRFVAENAFDLSKCNASSSNLNTNISDEVTESVPEKITSEVPIEKNAVKKKTVKTLVDGYLNIDKFIEEKLIQIKQTSKITTNVKKCSDNSDAIGSNSVQENNVSAKGAKQLVGRSCVKETQNKTKLNAKVKLDALYSKLKNTKAKTILSDSVQENNVSANVANLVNTKSCVKDTQNKPVHVKVEVDALYSKLKNSNAKRSIIGSDSVQENNVSAKVAKPIIRRSCVKDTQNKTVDVEVDALYSKLKNFNAKRSIIGSDSVHENNVSAKVAKPIIRRSCVKDTQNKTVDVKVDSTYSKFKTTNLKRETIGSDSEQENNVSAKVEKTITGKSCVKDTKSKPVHVKVAVDALYSKLKNTKVKRLRNGSQNKPKKKLPGNVVGRKQSISQKLNLKPDSLSEEDKLISSDETVITSDEAVSKHFKVLSEQGDSNEMPDLHKTITDCSLDDIFNVNVSEETKRNETTKQNKKQCKERSKKETIKEILNSSKCLDSDSCNSTSSKLAALVSTSNEFDKGKTSVSPHILNLFKPKTSDLAKEKTAKLNTGKKTSDNSLLLEMKHSSLDKPMLHIVSVSATKSDNKAYPDLNEPSCSYSVTPIRNKVVKFSKQSMCYPIKFPSRVSSHTYKEMNGKMGGNELVKRSKCKVSEFTNIYSVDASNSYKNTSEVLNSNDKRTVKSPKRKKQLLKVNMFPQYSRVKQTKEEEDEGDSFVSDDDMTDKNRPMKKIKNDNSGPSGVCPVSTTTENFMMESSISVLSKSQKASCSKANCQCNKIQKDTVVDRGVDFVLMQLIKKFRFGPSYF